MTILGSLKSRSFKPWEFEFSRNTQSDNVDNFVQSSSNENTLEVVN